MMCRRTRVGVPRGIKPGKLLLPPRYGGGHRRRDWPEGSVPTPASKVLSVEWDTLWSGPRGYPEATCRTDLYRALYYRNGQPDCHKLWLPMSGRRVRTRRALVLPPTPPFPKLGGRGRVTQPLQTQKAELVVSYLSVFRSICTVPPLYAFDTS